MQKLLLYKLYRSFGFPKSFPMNLTFGLTYKCNSKCRTCNIWKRKDFKKELSLEEIEKIFKKIGKGNLYLLILTGGETFLNRNIAEICQYAERYCEPKSIVIPTNALLGEYIVKKTEQILKKCRKSHITVNISIDHINEKHDSIRGIKGNFEKSMRVYKGLKDLEKKYNNFDVSIHTVISKFNYMDFSEIYRYVTEKLRPKNYITEVAENRVELSNLGDKITPSSEEYSRAIDFLIKKLESQKLSLKQAFRLEYYKMVKQILKEKKQVIPCYAGIASAQIDPTGEVWFCCIRAESIGNLRDEDYNLMSLWYNEKAKKQRKSIANKECYCPLASASYTNLSLDLRKSMRVVFNVLKSRLI